MKNKYTKLVLLVLLTFYFTNFQTVFAQVPQAINFQAIARDGSGNPMVNTNIQIRLSVVDSTQSGSIVYQELRALQTNAYGSFSFLIGVNPSFTTIGAFPAINWETGNKHLKIDYDPTNTFTFSLSLGTIRFVTVPYAFAAQTVAFIDATGAQNGDALVYNSTTGKFEPGQVSAGNVTWSNVLNKPTIDSSSTNEIQTLSISNDTIYLTNGGFVKLPFNSSSASLLPPTATTQTATNLQLSSPTLNGTINPNGLTTTVVFEWGLTSGYGNTIPLLDPFAGTSNIAVSANLSNLQSNTTYHYRIKAYNAANITYGDDITFTCTYTPIITLLGDNPLEINLGNIYTDPGATVTGGITPTTSGFINNERVGEYTVTYSAPNAIPVNRIVKVRADLLASTYSVLETYADATTTSYAQQIVVSPTDYNKLVFNHFGNFSSNSSNLTVTASPTGELTAPEIIFTAPSTSPTTNVRIYDFSGTYGRVGFLYNILTVNYKVDFTPISGGATQTQSVSQTYTRL